MDKELLQMSRHGRGLRLQILSLKQCVLLQFPSSTSHWTVAASPFLFPSQIGLSLVRHVLCFFPTRELFVPSFHPWGIKTSQFTSYSCPSFQVSLCLIPAVTNLTDWELLLLLGGRRRRPETGQGGGIAGNLYLIKSVLWHLLLYYLDNFKNKNITLQKRSILVHQIL